MTESPRTAAGRALKADLDANAEDWAGAEPGWFDADILAIETEARRATVERMLAMRVDFQTLPHAEFPIKWPDWKEWEEVLPTYCSCRECRLWRSGS